MAVLVATSFSRESVEAQRVAAAYARALQTSLTLVHVIEDGVTLSEAAAHQALESAAESLRAIGVTVETRVLHGPLAPTLRDVTRAAPPDLVVVGGSRPTGKDSFRGRSDEIARVIIAPVMVVRADSEPLHEALSNGDALSVFVAVDESQSSEAAIAWLENVRSHIACDIVVGHYFWPPHAYEQLGLDPGGQPFIPTSAVVEALEHEVRGRYRGLSGVGDLTVYCEPRIGSMAINLLSTARACNAHLVVVGSHRHLQPGRFTQRSISRAVLDHCERPVVCVASDAA